jgi:beta-phosphoglucomutase-like phosphatase (HAD superfamily)
VAGEVAAVVFDLDGVLIDSEPVWEQVRRDYVRRHGGSWHEDTQSRLMGMSTEEWASYLAGELGVDQPPEEVANEVLDRMGKRYGQQPPLLDGAVEAVERIGSRWPLGLASSSSRGLIDLVLRAAGMERWFKATVSTEEVPRGKPAPDVYLEVARRLDVDPGACVAVEDSSNGVRSAAAAGMRVIAIPTERYPLDDDAAATSSLTLHRLDELTVDAVEAVRVSRRDD